MVSKLEDIGFYTLSEKRAKTSSMFSPLQRCEMLLTDVCNFKCPYCRGVKPYLKGDLPFEEACHIIQYWVSEGLQNIRFTGGEPTLYNHNHLLNLVQLCSSSFVKHIALSTNGTANLDYYEMLISHGVNDLSISLDGGCCEVGDKMTGGVKGSWQAVVDNIRELSKEVYVTLGMVFNEENVISCIEAVLYADSLNPSDIRIIPSAQYNKALTLLADLPTEILSKYPILRYRIINLRNGTPVRGIQDYDSHQCPLVLDDMFVAAGYHFPCVIYMREGGEPIGKINTNTRKERYAWFKNHNTHADNICRQNCLDVCREYNNAWESYRSAQ